MVLSIAKTMKSTTRPPTKQISLMRLMIPWLSKNVVTDERVEARLHGERESHPMSHEGNEKSHNGIYNRAMEAPVVQSDQDGFLSQLVVRSRRIGAVPILPSVVIHALSHSIEEQACADTASEQHGEPGHVVVLGLAVVRTQPDVAVVHVHNDDEYEPRVLGTDVQPREIVSDSSLNKGGDISNILVLILGDVIGVFTSMPYYRHWGLL